MVSFRLEGSSFLFSEVQTRVHLRCLCFSVSDSSFTNDEDDFGPRPGRVKHLVLLDELRRLRQIRVALDGELADGGEAVVPSVGEIGAVGQHCHTQKHAETSVYMVTWLRVSGAGRPLAAC